jgi:cytochrome c peroxidase
MRQPGYRPVAGGLCATLLLWLAPAGAPCGPQSGDAPFYANVFAKVPTARAMTSLGRKLFFDPALSSSGALSCASCHDPADHFGPPDGRSVQFGGLRGTSEGSRAVPSLMYTQNIPAFSEHFSDDEGDDSIDQGPAGGRTWDGRAASAHDQAREPLLSPLEMANSSERAIAEKLRRAPYAAEFAEVFGADVLPDDARLFRAALMSLETFQQDPALFYPYTSKYDAWLRRQVALTPQELRGLAVFNDPAKGNCARCHPSAIKEGGFPQFTDFGYVALGVPRNRGIAANADPQYFDLGLCGPLRTDLKDRKPYCGMFRTPSLRNVATRRVFFHNGVMHRLSDVLRFYAERDLRPERWYPRGSDGRVQKFDDLPGPYRANVDHEAPFDRHPGDAPALNAADIADLLAFLSTLTDGYRASSGGVSPVN